MDRFYEVVVKYYKIDERGVQIQVTELYLVLAVSCIDAETTLTGYLKQCGLGCNMDITLVKLAKYSEYIPKDSDETDESKMEDDKYFAVKLSFITLVEMKEKRTAVNYVVRAGSVEEANRAIVIFMRGSFMDYEVNNVIETKIKEVVTAMNY